jgi:hypothetical protein
MNGKPSLVAGLAVAALLLLTSLCSAQFPQQINYQVMLTDDSDQPLADQSVQMVFRLYEEEAGGLLFWTETQNVTTNFIGVASVVLGDVNPINFYTSGPMWLEVEVDGEIMTPRRQMTSAPYAWIALDALHAAEADHSVNSEHLGDIIAEAYALDDDLWQPGSLNDPSNPLEWTKLKNVPAGFADGVDNAGAGDGHSLDAEDGSPTDVVYVNADGYTIIGGGPPKGALTVYGPNDVSAGYFEANAAGVAAAGLFATADSSSGVVGNAKTSINTFPGQPSAVAGIGEEDANGGFFYSTGSGRGAFCISVGAGDALDAKAYGAGYSGRFDGGIGVLIENSGSYPVLKVHNHSSSLYGDAAYFQSNSGVSSATWTVYSLCSEGEAGRFEKAVDDDAYAVKVLGQSASSEGLFVRGSIYSTVPFASGVATARGTEAMFGVRSGEVDLIASGEGRLSDGMARVNFDRLFAEAISGPDELRVTATPVGRWSALYVEHMDESGFDLRSDAGDPDVEFGWVAVGRARGHELRPDVTIPDPEEEARVAAEKTAEVEARRPERREPPQVVTTKAVTPIHGR